MIPGFEALVEQRINEARKKGEFNNLEGKNKPIKFEDSYIPEDMRLGFKILKNAGFLPPELELKKKITQTEQLLESATADSPEHHKIQKKLNYLITKLNATGTGTKGSALLSGAYRENLINKVK
jgi:hypothetical protein